MASESLCDILTVAVISTVFTQLSVKAWSLQDRTIVMGRIEVRIDFSCGLLVACSTGPLEVVGQEGVCNKWPIGHKELHTRQETRKFILRSRCVRLVAPPVASLHHLSSFGTT